MLFVEIDILVIFIIFGVVLCCDVDDDILVKDRNILFGFIVLVGLVGLL